MTEVTMYKTSDGQIFESAAEADAHESLLQDEKIIDQFLDEQEWKRPAMRTRAKNTIMKFLDWKNRDTTLEAVA